MHVTLTILRYDDHYDFRLIEHPRNLTTGHYFVSKPTVNDNRSLAALGNHCLFATSEISESTHQRLQKEISATIQMLNMAGGNEQIRAPANAANSSAAKMFENLGRLLFTQIVPPSVQQQLRQLQAGSLIEFVTDDLNFPWEFLHDGQDFLALRHCITRLPFTSQPPNHHNLHSAQSKISCLLLGDPTGDLPAAEAEIQAIQEILYSVRDRVRYTSFYGNAITSLLLQEMLASQEYQLIHIACHARPGALKLADGWFQTSQLSKSLQNHPLIVLNACASIQSNPVSARFSELNQNLESLSATLIQGGAIAMIGMLWPIPDQAMQQWSKAFYQRLVMGDTVSAALRASRETMYQLDSANSGWLAPLLIGNPLHQPIPNALKKGSGTLLHLKFHEEMVERRQRRNRVEANDLQRSLTAICEEVMRHGGKIFYANSQGVLAAFGLYQSQDSDAFQAISAARSVRALATTWNATIPTAVVTSGEMLVSEQTQHHGSLATTDLPALLFGKPVFEAAQLTQRATDGQILVNQLARERCRDRFHFRTVTEEDLPTTQGHIYELISTPVDVITVRRTLNFDVTIGNAGELHQLQAAWNNAKEGRGSLIGISGEAGIGKSHLINHFRKSVASSHPQWVQVNCTAEMVNTPYRLLNRLFCRLLDLPDFAAAEQIQQALEAAFFNQPTDTIDSLDADSKLLMDLLSDQPQELRLQEQSVYQHQLFTLLRTLLVKKLERGALLLVLEDLHWSDSATMTVLTHLGANLQDAPILLLLVHRPDWVAPWQGKSFYQHIHLRQFDASTAHRYLQSLLGSEELPTELLLLTDRTGGNPLFLGEILVSLLEKGLLVPKEADNNNRDESTDSPVHWRLQGVLEPNELPDTIQRTIEMRLDQLERTMRTTLEMAAVVGTQFTTEMLRWGLPDAGNQIVDHLKKLVEYEFLRQNWGSPQYEFRHALIRDVTYAKTSPAQRQQWHRRLAEQLEQGYDQSRQKLADLAQHYYLSLVEGDTPEPISQETVTLNQGSEPAVVEKALGYLLQSGQDALDRYGAREAVTHFTRAEQVDRLRTRNVTRQAEIQRGLGHAYRMWNRFEPAIECYAEAHAAFHRQPITLEIRPQIAEIARWLAHLHMWRGEYESAEAWVETGLGHVQSYEEIACQSAVALLNIQAGSVCYNRGITEQAENSCRAGIALARRLGDESAIAEGNLVLGAIMRSIGKYEDALAYYQESMAIQAQRQNLYQINRLRMNIGVVHFSRAEWQQASAYYSEALDFWRKIDEQNLLAGIAINLGLIEHYQGNWDAAQKHYQQALSSCQEIGNSKWLARVHNNLGTLYLQNDNLRGAKEHIAVSWGLLESYDIQDLRADVRCSQALLAIKEQDWDQAQQLVEEAIAIATHGELALDNAIAMRILGQVYLGKEELEMAIASFQSSLAILEELNDKYELARTHYQLARAREMQQDWADARWLCNASLTAFEELNASYDLALANALRDRLL